jgi:hypothetical protein
VKGAPRQRLCGALASLTLISCAAQRPPAAAAPVPAVDPAQDERARAIELDNLTRDVLDLLAAADPRLAAREGATASADVLKRVGMDAIFAEDEGAKIRGGSLDLFAFRARGRALELAAAKVKAFGDHAPERSPAGGAIERPRIEYERLSRLVDEERTRVAEEEKLGDAAGDLVRAMVGTWTPPATADDAPDRDVWVTDHLHEIRDSLRGLPRSGPGGLDLALNPLEHILHATEYPKSAAAIAELRVALDEDMRPFPALVAPVRVAVLVKEYLGVTVDASTLAARLEPSIARIHELAVAALDAHADARKATEARARELLFVEGKCPVGPGTRVGAIAPPPERALSCGAVRALTEEPMPGAAIVALHDEVLLALAAASTSPPPRTRMLCHPDDDAVDAARREARERPVRFIAVLLAAELLFAPGVDPGPRLAAWRALGDAPFDIVAREFAVPP